MSSPFGKDTSAIFHSEDDVLVYEDFIRRSRQLAMTSQEQQGQNTTMTNTLATDLKFGDEEVNQQTTMDNNQTQQTANFEPDHFDSGISSHVRMWRQWRKGEWTSQVPQLLVAHLTIY